MKKLIIIALAAMISTSGVYATTKCQMTPNGFCCWDPNEDGPWPPINCQ